MKVNRMKSDMWRMVLQVNLVLFFLLTTAPCHAQDVASAGEKTKVAMESLAQTVGDEIVTLEQRISDSRLVNRSRDENVAFIFMGVLIGSVAGMFSKVKSSGIGQVGRLLLGLGGAFIGGMVVRVAQIDFGWGTISIGYEKFLFSLLGAIAIVGISRFVSYQMHKKPKSKS